MGYFPFFTDVTRLRGVIIGGGTVAFEKVTRLLPFEAKLTLIAIDICDEIKQYESKIEFIEDEYRSDYLDRADYVIAATNIPDLNRQIYADAKKRKLQVNVVDVPEYCDFIFPSVLQKGKLVVGVSSGGAAPRVAIRLRNEIEKLIPENIEEVLDYLFEERKRAKETISDPLERKKYLIGLADKLLHYEE
ncbi:MAG: bifunctional precorrin-2 dehydrogenase/sirohydrochlorin ferrochelatase [Acetatifactor sp.]|nr:bifunctional precorrin-2 dehydrogenase/sirohydrochlorin ferrochelatase [Acetatifactor sp.]